MTLYYVMFCDEWKAYSSMRLAMISSNLNTISDFVRKEIKAGNMCWESEELSKKEQLERFDACVAESNFSDDNLIYGYVSSTEDGEEI